MMETIKCKVICEKNAEGEIIYSEKSINFYLVNPKTSEVIENDHPLKGKKIKNKALVIPSGKGSSVVQLDGLYQLLLNDNNPTLIIVKDPDPVLVSAAVICKIPIVSGLPDYFFDYSKNGGYVKLNCANKELTIIH